MTHSKIDINIQAHDRIARHYEHAHGEIFNPVEQERLRCYLKKALDYVRSSSNTACQALDLGCGTGNLTAHLLTLDVQVTAADISPEMLQLVRDKFNADQRLNILQLNGQDLSNIEDRHYEFVATYSVLHHIPDYRMMVREMIRILKPGGVLYIDHEAADSFWQSNTYYQEYLSILKKYTSHPWKRFFRWTYYYHNFRRMFNSRYKPEGDIHVFPDDHIEWPVIEQIASEQNCEIVEKTDYLLYRRECPIPVYDDLKEKCQDTTLMIIRKPPSL